MKKQAIFFACCFCACIATAQNIPVIPDPGYTLSLEKEYLRAGDYLVHSVAQCSGVEQVSGQINEQETVIGTTIYDLQANKALANRFILYDDGTMAAVWTMGFDSPAFNDRGTGYNYFNGVSWDNTPSHRIEGLRTGWPTLAPLGPYGEIVVSSDFNASELRVMTRYFKGEGNWIESVFRYSGGPEKLAWPRVVTSGPDHETVHLLASTAGSYQGMTSAVLYSRSTDGGRNWDMQNILLDGMGPSSYREISADEYIWAAPKGNTVAFLVVSAWHDLFMMKSTDNGRNWKKTVIWEHPYPYFNWNTTITDTFFCVDNSASIALDKQGNAHVAFGISRVLHKETGPTYSLFPFTDGIGYWNEDMPAFSGHPDGLAPPQYGYPASEMEKDFNYIGWSQDVDGDGDIVFFDSPSGFPMVYREFGLSTMPAITVDEEDNVIVLFSSTTETYTNFEYNYKHIWARAYQDGAWGSFVDLTADLEHVFDECVYPVFGGTRDDAFHFIYMCDPFPGLAMDGGSDYHGNSIVHAKIPKDELLTGIPESPSGKTDFHVFQNHPNPFTEATKIRFSLKAASTIRLEIRDVNGHLVREMQRIVTGRGIHFIEIDGRNLASGIYFYTIFADGQTLTRKMVKF